MKRVRGIRRLAERPLIGLVLVPREIPRMDVRQEDLPLLARQPPVAQAGQSDFALPRAAVDIGAGVPRIVQDAQDARVFQRSKHEGAGTGAAHEMPGPREAFAPEVPDDVRRQIRCAGTCRTTGGPRAALAHPGPASGAHGR